MCVKRRDRPLTPTPQGPTPVPLTAHPGSCAFPSRDRELALGDFGNFSNKLENRVSWLRLPLLTGSPVVPGAHTSTVPLGFTSQ